MAFGETKVYFDGSHYIAIPHTERPAKKRPIKIEEVITVCDNETQDSIENTEPFVSHEENNATEELTKEEIDNEKGQVKPKQLRKMTKKELFNELYTKYIDLKKSERKKLIIQDMLLYFESEKYCREFVNNNFERKQRNLICRRIRMVRKANLVNFNYFCTFTYDDKLHTEQTFKKKLQNCFRNLCYRNNWKYMGVWERAPETKRLHFHGLFAIPENEMIGELEQHEDYSFSNHRRIRTMQNSFFNKKFGRSDFEEIKSNVELHKELSYIMKYLEKTEEKIVYSKGLYQYFISDIMDEDIVCTIGQEDKKLLLFDDFNCWDEGCLIGKVSPEVIAQMRKCN